MKLLHLDIETAPHKVYAWGLWKQNIAINQIEEPGYTLCWAAKWHGKKEVLFDSLQRSSNIGMLRRVYELLDEADAVCHYNGTRFDLPTLNQEFAIHNLPPPSPYHQIDLLRTARKSFRLPSNKLDYVARHLGLGSKLAHKGMTLWLGCMQGNEKDWRIMEKYNKQDVRLLEKVYKKVLPWIENHPNVALYNDNEQRQCPTCGSHKLQSRGYYYTRTQRYRKLHCTSCGKWSRERVNATPPEKNNVLC